MWAWMHYTCNQVTFSHHTIHGVFVQLKQSMRNQFSPFSILIHWYKLLVGLKTLSLSMALAIWTSYPCNLHLPSQILSLWMMSWTRMGRENPRHVHTNSQNHSKLLDLLKENGNVQMWMLINIENKQKRQHLDMHLKHTQWNHHPLKNSPTQSQLSS